MTPCGAHHQLKHFLSRQASTPPPFHSLFCESNFPNLTYLERTTKPASPRSQNRRYIVMVFERYEIALCHHDAYQVLPSFQFQPPNRFLSCEVCRATSISSEVDHIVAAAQKVLSSLYLLSVCLSPVKAAFLAPFGPNCLLGQVFRCDRFRGHQKYPVCSMSLSTLLAKEADPGYRA